MCGIDTVNGTLGMEWGVGNELTGSEFYLGYIKFSLSLWVSTRDHSSHPKLRKRMCGTKPPLTSKLESSKIKFGQPHCTAFCLSN